MRRTTVTLVALLVGGPLVAAAEPLAPEQFARLQTLIKPGERDQKWQQIPWTASLWQAREKAAEQGKPILLWEMDGHPLGCV